MWSKLIYYVGNISDALADIKDEKKRPLHFNLKWSKTPELHTVTGKTRRVN